MKHYVISGIGVDAAAIIRNLCNEQFYGYSITFEVEYIAHTKYWNVFTKQYKLSNIRKEGINQFAYGIYAHMKLKGEY